MASFLLSNISLQVEPGLITPSSRKILKVQSATQKPTPSVALFRLKEPAQVINGQNLEWGQTLTLPARYSVAFPFQIATEHTRFGYNPEDIDSVLEGRMVIKRSDRQHVKWQVFKQERRVGYLCAHVQVRSKEGGSRSRSKEKIAKIVQNNSSFFGGTIDLSGNSIAFLSLYANFPKLTVMDKRRVYLQFQVGSTISRSAIKKLHQNEYRSHQALQLKHYTPSADKLTLSAFSFDAHLNKIQLLGKGNTQLILPAADNEQLPLDERVKLQRVFLHDDGQEIGWVSFKYLKSKQESLDPRYFLQDKFTTIGDVNFQPLKNASMTIADVGRSRIKMMSPLQANSRIFIPKSERFDNPAKRKKCEQIGIKHQSVDIKDYPSTHRYKVASFGFGHKIMPVERDRDVPGSGRYQLPTLFDCYK